MPMREIGLHRVSHPTLAGFGILSEKGKQESSSDLKKRILNLKKQLWDLFLHMLIYLGSDILTREKNRVSELVIQTR